MKKYRSVISIVVLCITVAVFINYLKSHPEVLQPLRQVNLLYVFIIMGLYLAIIVTLSVVNSLSVRICGKRIGRKESFNLTGSSSIANFFGPLQSGVGIRAVYFKTKLKIPIKEYGLASLYYYALYAFLSGLFLLFGNPSLRFPLVGALIAGIILSFYYIRYRAKRNKTSSHVTPELLAKLASAVLVQLIFITTIYFLELLALGKSVSFAQIISYSGAANFSLFVAVTPGAIGIREAFLVFSEKLHGIDASTIIAANVLDRGIYVIFLGLLFLWLVGTHTRVKLTERRQQEQP